jgi:hypothetical protein
MNALNFDWTLDANQSESSSWKLLAASMISSELLGEFLAWSGWENGNRRRLRRTTISLSKETPGSPFEADSI